MIETVYQALFAPFVDFGFMRRALIGCLALAISATPVGVFLMLRRMSLTGDAVAHAILPGAALGYMVAGLSLGAMTLGGLIAGWIVALLAGGLARITVLKEDANLAVFYLVSLALGVLLVSTQSRNIDLLHLLFGSVLALNNEALILLAGIATITLILLAIFLRPLVLECLDPDFLRRHSNIGTPTHLVFLALVVLNLVAGFQALGTLMAVGIMILPATAARFWARQLDQLLFTAVALAMLGCWLGLLMSWHLDLPTGPAIILMLGLLHVFSLFMGRDGLLKRWLHPGKHLKS
ncbi:metal ABC transporter permease [Marinospirillum alkaliphilum]|uniref:Zinc/manganese transport system permease protein n=1 Tax=Marinospirillum alkaliphilum DSM 21637 TaxID=1122209 RepID=A0A1K1WUV1_9GAMM|nr:metal ABC transporter permease [Marinospirillum alkaliphilum]SFX40581.1 zinc/manganese transport system permease protein [Marinospirillum alkaliphilum DSM 21637]